MEQDLNTIRDEVFRKIGKNLLDFQKIEQMLKHLIASGKIAGYATELQKNMANRQEAVHKKTMGALVGEYVENTFQSSEDTTIPIPNPERKESYLSHSFSVEADLEFYENKRQALKSLVDERNDLIHHLLPKFNPESLESCLEINDYLELQKEKLIPEYEFLKVQIGAMAESQKVLAEFLNSEEGQRHFELPLIQQSPIIQLLLNLSIQKPRPDGWSYLSSAIQQIHKILPSEMGQLKVNWGYGKLTDLMRASEFFDVTEEPLDKGGYRLIYRSKPELAVASFSRVLRSILEIVEQTKTTDGWVSLANAEQTIVNSMTKELGDVQILAGCTTFKELLVELGYFEFYEHSENGQITTLFRSRMCD